jgi:hypothetical protein
MKTMISKHAHFCGHIISESGRFPKRNEKKVKSLITSYVSQNNIGTCYGSLAAGADILICEAVVENNGDIHVVLPFDEKTFIDLSVENAKDNWRERFSSLFQRASSITQVYQQKPIDDNISFALCTEIAMGLCLFNSTLFSEKPLQLAVWDEEKTENLAGTFPDLLRWQKLGFESKYIPSKQADRITTFLNDQKSVIVELKIQVTLLDTIYISTLAQLMTFIEQLPLPLKESRIKIDLDNRVYGKNSDKVIKPISNRALGHIVYHAYVDNDGNKPTSILNKITTIMSQE